MYLPLADPNVTDPANRLKKPFSEGSFLGTDHLGRDLLSRLLHGTRLSLLMGIGAAVIAAFVGSTIGLFSAYYGGRVDNWLMRGIDMLMAFPCILLALAIVAVLGPGLLNALYAVAIVNIPFFARNIRGATLGIVHKEYIDAARLAGLGNLRIIAAEVLPNVMPVIVVAMSTTIGWMILETAGLSFLGLGSQPPQADLGSMLGEGRKLLINAPHASVVPGVMIFILVVCINLLGDGIRDVLDPRLRSGALSRPAAVTLIDRDQVPAPSVDGALLDVAELRTEFRTGSGADRRVYRAVGGVDFAVSPGECVGLVGESGSGKSVTALSLLGLVASPPGVITGGAVHVRDAEGRTLETLSSGHEALRSLRGGRIAYIFQDPLSTLHPLKRIGDQLVEAIRCHQSMDRKSAWRHATALLEQVQLPNAAERMNVYPHELSGGMRQRISIAMALVNDPDLVIADEPTTALDVTVQQEVLALLADLRARRKLSLIFISHDLAVVGQLCDRIMVMYAGNIVESGTTQQVLDAPLHPYTEKLLAAIPTPGAGRQTLTAIPGVPPSTDALPAGCAFRERCHRASERCASGEVAVQRVSNRQVRCWHPVDYTGEARV